MTDKTAKLEPKGTVYDSIFASRDHKSKEMAKRIDGTSSHDLTRRWQEEKLSAKKNFEEKYTSGDTLMEKANLRKEANVLSEKYKRQMQTADALRSQMDYKIHQRAIERHIDAKIKELNEFDSKIYRK